MGLLAFLFVIGLLLLTLWFLKSKTALGGSSGTTNMRIVDTLRIDPKNRVCVLDYGDRRLLLGISSSAITLLDAQNLDATEIAGEAGEAALNKEKEEERMHSRPWKCSETLQARAERLP